MINKLKGPEIQNIIDDIYTLYTQERAKKGGLPDVTDTDLNDIKTILNHLLQKLMNFKPSQDFMNNPDPSVYDEDNRIKLILVIKQLLGWDGLELDQNNMPTYNALNDFIMKLQPAGLPEEDKPIQYLLDNF